MNNPPLWQAMRAADSSCTSDFTNPESRAIIAVRDWLIKECRSCELDQDAVYQMLTAEAERGEIRE